MNNAIATRKPLPLDEPSEGMLIWEQERFPQWNYGAFTLCGPCDVEALDHALCAAQADYPTFHAVLEPYRRGLWTSLGWRIQAEPVALEVCDFTSLPEPPANLDAWIHAEMAPHIARVQDLQRVHPVRFLLFRLPADRQVLVFLFHHVVTDGGGFYDFLAKAFLIYHRQVMGRDPEWAGCAGMHAQAGAAEPIAPISTGRFLREMISEWRKYPPRRVAQIASRPSAPTGRKVVRLVIDDAATQCALRDRARRDGGTVSDLFVAATKGALDAFNEARGADHETMVHGLAVNQRLRQSEASAAGRNNLVGMITISSNSADRRDPASLLRRVIAERKRKLAAGYDLRLAMLGQKLLALSHILPMSLRGPALRPLIDVPLSLIVTNLGVVWPCMENGRPTGKTAIREIGRMELLDVCSCTGVTEKNCGALILRTFLDRLTLAFQFGRHKITDDDADAYAQLVLDHAKRFL